MFLGETVHSLTFKNITSGNEPWGHIRISSVSALKIND